MFKIRHREGKYFASQHFGQNVEVRFMDSCIWKPLFKVEIVSNWKLEEQFYFGLRRFDFGLSPLRVDRSADESCGLNVGQLTITSPVKYLFLSILQLLQLGGQRATTELRINIRLTICHHNISQKIFYKICWIFGLI